MVSFARFVSRVGSGWAAFCFLFFNVGYSQTITHSMTDKNGGSLHVGDTLTYNVTLTNNTADTLSGVTLQESAPAGSLLDESSFVMSKGTISVSDGEVRTIDLSVGEMAPNEVVDFAYDVTLTGSPLYLINSANPPKIYKLDKTTGAAEFVMDVAGQSAMYGLGLTSDAKTLYGVNSKTDKLIKMDLRDKTTTEIGSLNLGRNVGVPCLDLTADDVIFAADSSRDTFFRIDSETGQAHDEAPLGVDIRGGDCAFAADGRLMIMSNTNNGKGALWIKNFATGKHQLVANVSDSEFFTGVALGTDSLFGSGTSSDSLFGINKTTGAGDLVGSFGIAHGGGDLAMAASQTLQLKVTGTIQR